MKFSKQSQGNIIAMLLNYRSLILITYTSVNKNDNVIHYRLQHLQL